MEEHVCNKYLWGFLLVFLLLQACTASLKYSYEQTNLPFYSANHSTTDPNSEPDSNFMVVSFNIEFAQNIDGAIHLLSTHPLINSDVLLLQEMDEKGVEQIAKSLGYNYVYYPAIYHPKYAQNVGNAILSKWPILNSKKVKLPYPSLYLGFKEAKKYNFRKTATVADIQINGKVITFASTHAPAVNPTEIRRSFAQYLAEHISHNTQHPIVVGGDFNSMGSADIEATKNEFLRLGFEWPTKDIGITVSEKKSILKVVGDNAFQLDHIFTKDLQDKNIGKVDQVGISDHLPIWAKLSF